MQTGPPPQPVNLNQLCFMFLFRSLGHEHPSFSQVSFIQVFSANLELLSYVEKKSLLLLDFAIYHLLSKKETIS